MGMKTSITVFSPAAVPAQLAQQEMARAVSYGLAEKAKATRTAYGSDAAIFKAWCAARGLHSLPAEAGTVARFLAAQADSGLKASTIGRRAAAVAYMHKLAGHEPPTSVEAVRSVLRGIRRTVGTASAGKAAATDDLIVEMLKKCPATVRGLRDRAILAFGLASACRRSELAALQVSDLLATVDGYRVTIRHSKGDQDGAGQEIAVPRGCRIEPVKAVEAWLAAAKISDGPLFRRIVRGGHIQAVGLDGQSIAKIVKHYAGRAGLDPAAFSGHSLRRGFLSSAAANGASALKMQAQSRHKSLNMLLAYVETADRFKEHAGSKFL
jgi:site-specific recombinase XerD